jgi:hypothetical protein
MKTRIWFFLTLTAVLNPVGVLADETRDASELSTGSVKCRDAGLKKFKASDEVKKFVSEGGNADEIVTTKVSGDAA